MADSQSNRPRYFGTRERATLYLASEGKCSRCGVELEPGWHADHVQPYSGGGITDVVNGQALCPDCNLKKGASVDVLRPWQQQALARFLQTTDDFLAVACPGAGKTRFALEAARQMRERREAHRVIVVVPTAHLKVQWASAAVGFQLRLDERFENGAGAIARDMDGVVVTYQSVASNALLYRRLASQHPTLVILDEVHHGGDSLAWGEALRSAFDGATRRLLLSGTPTRTDRRAVPFVSYKDNGLFDTDGTKGYVYDYGAAIQDHVVRPIEFLALDGEMRWREAGQVLTVTLADADDETLTNALRAALEPDGDWMKSVLSRADQQLTRHRSMVPDAGGLVIAPDQWKAGKYAAMLKAITGEPPTLAISDEPDASGLIKSFTDGRSRWLVAVQMVSEGVDIPRLAVGVYASRIRESEMFFRQVVGRFVRMRGDQDETTATLMIPSIEPLLRYAQNVEQVVNLALRQEEDRVRQASKDREWQAPLGFDFDPMHASEAQHYSTILSGEGFSRDELEQAELHAKMAGLPASVSASQVAKLIRLVGQQPAPTRPQANHSITTPADDKAEMRRLVNRKVGRLHRLTEKPHAHIHAHMNQLFGDKPDIATAETLERRLDWLDEQIQKA